MRITARITTRIEDQMAGYADGVPCWADAMLNDLEAGKRFYGELLGWSFGATDPEWSSYTQAYGPGGKNVAALSPKPDGRMPTVWNLYLASSDIQDTARRIRDAGGQLIMEPAAVGSFGSMLTAADPTGAVFGGWQAGTHPGFGTTGQPGSYIWSEIFTRDAARTDAFYEEVFGYRGKEIFEKSEAGTGAAGDAAATDFRIFVPAGRDVAVANAVLGRFRMSGRYPDEMPPHILVYFAVEDADRAAETVVRLGGRVTRGPLDSPFGRFLLVSDDQGAQFGLIDPTTTVGEKPS
ncbi:VOC family protein [Streptomyces sp. MI02-7b]|uniref:VOC family protein n=1 Tax=Streptomyces sp. MI02-7b TaxID=462941 RepID=UPI0029C9D28C|nr:VOC family protein [Streptomyces sp. MI02-7b]